MKEKEYLFSLKLLKRKIAKRGQAEKPKVYTVVSTILGLGTIKCFINCTEFSIKIHAGKSTYGLGFRVRVK